MQFHTQGLAPKTSNHYVCLPCERDSDQNLCSISNANRYGRTEECCSKYCRNSHSALQEPLVFANATTLIISKSGVLSIIRRNFNIYGNAVATNDFNPSILKRGALNVRGAKPYIALIVYINSLS